MVKIYFFLRLQVRKPVDPADHRTDKRDDGKECTYVDHIIGHRVAEHLLRYRVGYLGGSRHRQEEEKYDYGQHKAPQPLLPVFPH